MRYYAKIETKNIETDRKQKLFNNIGIIACVISILTGLMIRNTGALLMLVPLWYLVSLKQKQSALTHLKSVEFVICTECRKLTFINCEYRNKRICSVCFCYEKIEDLRLYYNYETHKCVIMGNFDRIVIQDNEEVEKMSNVKKIEMLCDANSVERISMELGLEIERIKNYNSTSINM